MESLKEAAVTLLNISGAAKNLPIDPKGQASITTTLQRKWNTSHTSTIHDFVNWY